ncbi:hypothetical protein LPTSP4_08570 [Leptospira ryugenii]|uniref:Metallo-beta-lactamase domain-containing protein n=1 Tax=Leptospira ryugenii TaxID=1917863 RepID=A0A2P2DXL3_9LEPT|nr:MBL fold metallo-hydrolase [Leptospira ryugenii]GBF49346.1 hypothetical protein LPTSP4_08570 [Leptospira ryugenii]
MRQSLFILSFCFLLPSCFLFRSIEKPSKQVQFDQSNPQAVKLHWLGHASLVIQIYDKWIITDPNFSESLGLVVKRYIASPLESTQLPKFDAVLISHSHFDHLDKDSLQQIPLSGKLYVPKGAGIYIPSRWDARKKEMVPWQMDAQNDLEITAVPARHFGGRWLFDNLWDGEPYTGYVIKYKDVTIYFAGDTGYQKKEFEEIGKRFSIDIALLPVGPSKGPGNPVHINPEEAVDTFLDLNAKYMIPMHFGTFYRSMESELPHIQEVLAPLGKKAIILSIGDTYSFKGD